MFFNFNKIEQISPQSASDQGNLSNAIFLDVREVNEYMQFRIPGGILFPMSLMKIKENDLEQYLGKDIIVYCHVGNRSLQVSKWLDSKGFKVKNLTGGIMHWVQAGFPVESGNL